MNKVVERSGRDIDGAAAGTVWVLGRLGGEAGENE